MNERKQFLNGKIRELTEEKQAGVSPERLEKIEKEITGYTEELDRILKSEQEAAHKVVIKEATEKAAYIMDNLVIEGLTVRELSAGEQEYQLLKIGVQGKFIEQAEAASVEKQLVDLENRELRSINAGCEHEIEKLLQSISDLKNEIMSLNLDKKDSDSKRDAAVAKAEGLELLLKTKQEEIELMRTEKAVGAVNAHGIVDIETRREEMKTLADQIKASRIHVYDVTPDSDINPKNYTAKRADTGELITFNWTQKNKYIELKTEDEVSQFRAQHTQENNLPDIPLAEPVEELTSALIEVVPPEVTFPDNFPLQSGDAVDQGPSKQVARTDEEALEEAFRRIVKLEADVEVLKRGNGMVA